MLEPELLILEETILHNDSGEGKKTIEKKEKKERVRTGSIKGPSSSATLGCSLVKVGVRRWTRCTGRRRGEKTLGSQLGQWLRGNLSLLSHLLPSVAATLTLGVNFSLLPSLKKQHHLQPPLARSPERLGGGGVNFVP